MDSFRLNLMGMLTGAILGLIVGSCAWNADGLHLNGPAMPSEDIIIVYPDDTTGEQPDG